MIVCEVCGSSKSSVLDTRRTGTALRRRRRCDGCGERWTTYEVSSAFVCFANDVAKLAAPLMEAAQAIGVAAADYEVEQFTTADSMGYKATVRRLRKKRASRPA